MDVTALAALASNALVTAAVTDMWEDVRHKIAAIFGRGEADSQTEERFGATRGALEAATSSSAVERVRAEQAALWAARLTVLLEDHPDAAEELDALVAEIRASAALGSDHSVAAGRDMNVMADRGGVAAGVIHGDVTAGPTWPGPVSS